MPEGVDPLVRVELADRVGPALRDQLAILLRAPRGENSASLAQRSGL